MHAQQRLFGASRDGTLFEINFATKKHVGVIGSGGGAVFCLTSLCPCCSNSNSNKSEKKYKCRRYIAAVPRLLVKRVQNIMPTWNTLAMKKVTSVIKNMFLKETLQIRTLRKMVQH